MNCAECEHLKIVIQPLRGKEGCYELGRAECKKYDLVTDFLNMGKFKRMTCPEECKEGEDDG